MIIVAWKYGANTATFQRIWGLAQGIAQNGEYVKIVFLMPNNGMKCRERCNNLDCVYLGEDSGFKNKYICLFYSMINLLKIIKKGDLVLYYTFLPILFFINLIPNIKIAIEQNEYPPFIFNKGILGYLSISWFLRIARKAFRLFVISEKLKEYFVMQGVDSDKISIINMTVDSKRFTNIDKQKTERYIAYCGSVTIYKDGVDILLNAFSSVVKKMSDVKLYILGSIPYESDKKQFVKIMEEKGLMNKVHFLGVVECEFIPQYLKNAEILALARPNNIQSIYGFPTKLGEYLLSENPVVVTRVGELDFFLKDKENCLFAQPNSSTDFADKLLWLLEHKDAGINIGRNGKKVAESKFDYYIEAQKIVWAIRND